MKPDYETYTLTPKTPVSCDGIRVSGCAGGSAYFISCGELIVKASVSETAPAAETEVETEAAVEESVAETEAETVAEETVAETEAPAAEETVAEETVEEAVAPETADENAEKAPQTADLALVSAAVAAVSSLGAYVVSKKRR